MRTQGAYGSLKGSYRLAGASPTGSPLPSHGMTMTSSMVLLDKALIVGPGSSSPSLPNIPMLDTEILKGS